MLFRSDNTWNKPVQYKLANAASGGRGCCRLLLKGECTAGEGCKYWHPDVPNPRKICAFFQRVEGCKKEANCGFHHIEVGAEAAKVLEAQIPKRSQSPAARRYIVCGKFLSGNCAYGADCTFAHPIVQ